MIHVDVLKESRAGYERETVALLEPQSAERFSRAQPAENSPDRIDAGARTTSPPASRSPMRYSPTTTITRALRR